MHQSARFDAPTRRCVRRTRNNDASTAGGAKPPLRPAASIDAFRKRTPPGGWSESRHLQATAGAVDADKLPPPARAGHTTDVRRWRHPHPTRHREVDDETKVDEATHGWTERTETGSSPGRGRWRRTPSQQPLHGSRPRKRPDRKCEATRLTPSTRPTTE